MNDQLIHILDHSACLSRRQVRDYLAGTMEQEEQHAVELHLVACPLCGLAMEGFESHPSEATANLAGLNAGFLKEHFDKLIPQIHLNSMSPAYALPSASRKRSAQSQPVWKHILLISSLLTVFALLWYFEFGRERAPKIDSAPAPAVGNRPAPVQTAPASVSTSAKTHKPKIHPNDEALIREAKAMNGATPAELDENDEELTRLFEEARDKAQGIDPAKVPQPRAAVSGAVVHQDSGRDQKAGGKVQGDSSDNEGKNTESTNSGNEE